jgi:hypothetical protein
MSYDSVTNVGGACSSIRDGLATVCLFFPLLFSLSCPGIHPYLSKFNPILSFIFILISILIALIAIYIDFYAF